MSEMLVMSEKPRSLMHVFSAVIVVLFVAVGTRVAYELLEPLVPGLLVLLALIVIFGVVFGLFRR